MPTPVFDDRDAEILAEREAVYNARPGPRVGDFVRMLDGTVRRFTYAWPDAIQTTYFWRDPTMQNSYGGGGSFYFGHGYIEYSGSLDHGIPLERIRDTGESEKGAFWFFHHNDVCAHNGVRFQIACRMFEELAP